MFAFAVCAVVCILGNLESTITQFSSNLLICSSWPKSLDLCSVFLYHCTSVCVIFVPLQDLTMKLSLIQSIGLIAKAISQCVKKQGYIFTRKQELINVMLVSWCFLKTLTCSWNKQGSCPDVLFHVFSPGFHKGRTSRRIEDSSAPSCDHNLCQPFVSFNLKNRVF